MLQAECFEQRLVDARRGTAHRVAVVRVVSDGIGDVEAVQRHRRRLAAERVSPVEERPHFLIGGRPPRRGAVDQAPQIGQIGRGVGDDFHVVGRCTCGRTVGGGERLRRQRAGVRRRGVDDGRRLAAGRVEGSGGRTGAPMRRPADAGRHRPLDRKVDRIGAHTARSLRSVFPLPTETRARHRLWNGSWR